MSDQLDTLGFELERRVILFKSTTTLEDESLLGYDGDPNNVTLSTPGESLLYNSPVGTRYQQDNGLQWYKEELPNIWRKFGGLVWEEIEW
jgi:hypothetical protein